MKKEATNIKSTILGLIGIFCAVLIITAFVLSTHALANGTSNSTLPGDINRDGQVDILDLTLLKLMLLGQETPSDIADVDGNNIINFLDIDALLDQFFGKVSTHGGGGGGGGGSGGGGVAVTNQVNFELSTYMSSYGPGTTGDTFHARVKIAQTSFLYNGSFTVDYNSSILQVNNVSSELFATTCVINMVNGTDWIDTAGQLTVFPNLSSCATNGSGVSGSGYLCDITFETKGAGTSPLTLGSGILYQSQSGNISAIAGTTWINSSAQISQLYSLNITSDDHGNVSTPVEAVYIYSAGQVVNLVATPDTCYHFDNWTGGGIIADVNDPTTTITMNGDYAIQANFAINTYNLSVAPSLGAGGSPSFDGENPFSCGTNATIHANTNSCYTFSGWTGPAVSAGKVANPSLPDTTVRMDGNYIVTANYSQTQYTLTVGTSTNGSTNPSAGPHQYGCGNVVSILATPADCFRLDHWVSDNSSINNSASNPLSFNIYGNTAVTPYFVPSASYTLSLTAYPLEGGMPTANLTPPIDCGLQVALSANASTCYNFSYWEVTSGSLVISTPNASSVTITMRDDYSITAHYTIKQYTLTTAVSPVGAGTVTGGDSYNCNASVQVTATAIAPYIFNYWSGGGINGSTNNPENVTMNSAKTVTAVFKTNPNTVYCENVGPKTHNTSFTLKVMALNITPNVAAGQFDLKYDPNILAVYNLSNGIIGGANIDMIPSGLNQNWIIVTSGVPGGKYILRVIPTPDSPASGSGYFCQITFNATAAGTSALEFVEGEGSPSGQLILDDDDFPPNELDVTWLNGSVTVQ